MKNSPYFSLDDLFVQMDDLEDKENFSSDSSFEEKQNFVMKLFKPARMSQIDYKNYLNEIENNSEVVKKSLKRKSSNDFESKKESSSLVKKKIKCDNNDSMIKERLDNLKMIFDNFEQYKRNSEYLLKSHCDTLVKEVDSATDELIAHLNNTRRILYKDIRLYHQNSIKNIL